MPWTSLFLRGSELSDGIRKRLHPHQGSAFCTLLFVGDLLMLLLFWITWSLQRHTPALRVYDLWIAGLAATFWILFICAQGSARLNGYSRRDDPWVRTATTIMLVLSFVAVISYY